MRRAVPVLRCILALGCLVCWAAPASAIDSQRAISQALIRKWQIQQGLPQPTITVVTQTSDGTLWLGTEAGLYQFDGVRFDAALVINGEPLDNVWVNDLCEDREGNLWVATRGDGLMSVRHGEVTRIGSPVAFPMERINCLLLDRNGDLWAGGEGGVAHYRNRTFRRYDSSDGLQIPDVQHLAQGPDDALWIGGNGVGLAVFREGQFQSRRLQGSRTVNALLFDRDGTLWAGTGRGLLQIPLRSDAAPIVVDRLAADVIGCLTQTQDGTLWVGTRNGVCRLTTFPVTAESDMERFGTRDGLTQSAVLTIYEDHETNLWIGTRHGLNQLIDRRTIPLTTTEGLPTNEAGPIVEDADGQVWIGTLGGGLSQYRGRRCETVVSRRNGLPNNHIRALAAGRNSELWIAADGAVSLWRDGEIVESYSRAHGLPVNHVTCLAIDDAGQLWAGTLQGLVRLSGDRFVPAFADQELATASVFTLLNAGDDGIVAATARGVVRLHEGEVTHFPGDPDWLKNVTAIARGPEGEYWLAARGFGLLQLNQGRMTTYTISDGLFDDEIVGIALDRQRLWMGCSRGVFSVRRRELMAFQPGSGKPLDCWSLSPTEALRTVECQRGAQPAVTRTTDGRIWFSTIHGVIVVNPENLFRGLPTPKVAVTRLQVNGRPTQTHLPLTVPPGPLNLSVRYTAHSYASPTRTNFRYQLQGFDRDWIVAGSRREAFYTNLPPGQYTFRVSAANPGEPWTEAALPIQLTLPAAFWQTLWFPVVLGLLVLGSVWLFLRLRVLQVRTRMDAIVSERARIARELHDTLIQGFSGVTMQMQAVSARVSDAALQQSIQEVIADAGACLREARQSVAGLRNSLGSSMGLSAAIEQTARQLTETRDVRLQLELPPAAPSLPVEVEFNLLRIAQEAIANAARHANARTIDVALLQHPGRLALRVRDDGIGFSVAEREQTAHRHYGLIGMRERSRQIAADLTIESRPGAGTTILVDLPLGGDVHPGGAAPSAAFRKSDLK